MNRRRGLVPPARAASAAVVLAIVVVASAVLVGASTGLSQAAPLAAGSSTSLVPFATRAGYSSSLFSAVSDPTPAAGSVEIVVTFESPDPAFYGPVDASAPAMTEAAIGDAYGLSNASYAAAERYFEAEGLSVLHAWPDRLSLSLIGPASAVGVAFGTELLAGSFEGRSVMFPSTTPSLPSALESEIAGVSGLESGFSEFSLPYEVASATGNASDGPDQNSANLVTPTDARQLYNVSALYNLTSSPTYASDKAIVLLLWGWGYSPADLSTFWSVDYPKEFPRPTVKAYPVDGAPEPSGNAVNDPSQGARELTLDIEWSGSMAPGATLDAVYAPPGSSYSDGYSPTDAGMEDAINTAVDPATVPNVAAISMSFGSADGQDPAYQAAFETAFQTATREHITLFAATGDTGGDAPSSSGGCSGTPQPEYPAASTQVVAVGGTDVSIDRSVLGSITGFTESAWSDSGGGFSTDYKAPSWQLVGSAAAPISSAGGYRGMPDVAASAAYDMLYYNGTEDAGEGTSFASPFWAGIVTEMDALRGTNFGFLTPALYSIATGSTAGHPSFHDVTSGSNCVASAGPGWDAVTGWGSPDAANLYEHLVSSFVNLTVSVDPSLIAPGGSVTLTAIVTNATSGAALASLPVVLTLGSTGLGGPCSGTFGSATVTSNASGGVSTSFSVSACYLGSSAIANVVVESDGYYGSASTSIAVNLLGFAPWLAPLAQYPTSIVTFVVIMAVATLLGVGLGLPGSRRADPYPASAPVGAVAPSGPPEPPGPYPPASSVESAPPVEPPAPEAGPPAAP